MKIFVCMRDRFYKGAYNFNKGNICINIEEKSNNFYNMTKDSFMKYHIPIEDSYYFKEIK